MYSEDKRKPEPRLSDDAKTGHMPQNRPEGSEAKELFAYMDSDDSIASV